MPIYDRPVRLLMREMADQLAPKPNDIITKHDVLSWFRKHYPKIKESTVTAHLTRLSTNAPSRPHYHAKTGEDDVFFQIDSNRYRRYNPATDPPPIHEGTRPSIPSDSEAESPESADEFAYEDDLRNFLAKNLSVLEPGLRLYEEEDIRGIEFPAGGRFIDILALDTANNYVVIELKVSRGYDRVVGQLLRYTAWIAKHHAEASQAVRGIIVAREISEDLLLACSNLPQVQLFEYQLAVSLKPIKR